MKGKINNLTELSVYLDVDARAEAVARRLYKDTECGISFFEDPDKEYVSVSGYTEGVDQPCPAHILHYPFTAPEFDEAVKAADEDGCSLWGETHGCDKCDTLEVDGRKPVDPNCPSCQGGGMVF